jgi:K(+)-stimulated pyrophosphate-energized sodium pump
MTNVAVTFSAPLGLLGLVVAALIYVYLKRQPVGNELMAELGSQIREGARTFLKREYSVLIPFIIVVAFLLYVALGSLATSAAYIGGALCSLLAGFFGMNAATEANVRTSEAARDGGQGKALRIAFNGGAVMGLSVGSLGLLGIGVVLFAYSGGLTDDSSFKMFSEVIAGFAMGASSRRRLTSAPTWLARSRRGSPRTILAIRRRSPITWVTTSATWPVWAPTSSSRMSAR